MGKKSWIHKIPTRKNIGPTKYQRDEISDPQNTHEKTFWTYEIPPTTKFWTREIPTKKNFGPTKAQLHDTHNGTRPTEFSTLNITLLLNCVSINLGTINKHYVRTLTLIVEIGSKIELQKFIESQRQSLKSLGRKNNVGLVQPQQICTWFVALHSVSRFSLKATFTY